MKELDKNKEYITSNLNEERRKELLNYMINNDRVWENITTEDFSNGVIRWTFEEWDLAYEASASQDAVDANTLFQEIKLNKEFSYYLGDLSAEQLEEVRLEVIKNLHDSVFSYHLTYSDSKYLEGGSGSWILNSTPTDKVLNALTLFDIPDKNSENDLNNGQESIQEEFDNEASEGGGEKTEKQKFYYYNSKSHGPNFYTKEEVQFHNGEEWSEDLILYTQLGSNKKFATTKERFKKFKEVWI